MTSLRHPTKLLALPLALSILVIAACGTHGAPPTLGKAVTPHPRPHRRSPTLRASSNSRRSPPCASQVYYHGKLIPITGATTPAQLRIGGCYKPITAPLTDGNVPEITTPASPPPPPPIGRRCIPIPPAALTSPSPAAPTATSASPRAPTIPPRPLIDCGQPLDNKEQYFDLYPPETGSNSIATGSALVVPLSATRVTLAVKDGNARSTPPPGRSAPEAAPAQSSRAVQ